MIERCFQRLKQHRATATRYTRYTRYDKTPTAHQGMIDLTPLLMWL